jgi:hypothetical protein
MFPLSILTWWLVSCWIAIVLIVHEPKPHSMVYGETLWIPHLQAWLLITLQFAYWWRVLEVCVPRLQDHIRCWCIVINPSLGKSSSYATSSWYVHLGSYTPKDPRHGERHLITSITRQSTREHSGTSRLPQTDSLRGASSPAPNVNIWRTSKISS